MDGGYIDDKAISALRELGGDGFIIQMIDVFLVYAPKVMAEARGGLAKGNLEPLIRMGHSLRSSGRNLGMIRIAELATQVESAGRSGQSPLLLSLLDELDQVFSLTKKGLEELRKSLAP